MPVTNVDAQLIVTLLDGTTTVMQVSDEENIAATEVFGGLPQRIPGNTSLLNLKLGTLALTKMLTVIGDTGISFRFEELGSDIPAHPFAFLANNVPAGAGISEIWVTNSDNEEHTITVLANE